MIPRRGRRSLSSSAAPAHRRPLGDSPPAAAVGSLHGDLGQGARDRLYISVRQAS